MQYNYEYDRLTTARRAHVVAALVEGNSIRATCRMTGVSDPTVIKLLVDLGAVCAPQDKVLRDLRCKRVQVDKVWSFCHAKQKNIPEEKLGQFGYGDVWTFTAICTDTKLVPSWLVGSRDTGTATEFLMDLASRLANQIRLTCDGH